MAWVCTCRYNYRYYKSLVYSTKFNHNFDTIILTFYYSEFFKCQSFHIAKPIYVLYQYLYDITILAIVTVYSGYIFRRHTFSQKCL